ncbi:MAG: PQQ-binding-like beta-propeller repeat protein [Actinomycetota bacterium]
MIRNGLIAGVLIALAIAAAACRSGDDAALDDASATAAPSATATPVVTTTPIPTPTLGPASQALATIAEPTPTPAPWYDPESVGEPWGTAVRGVLTFRGSPTRSWYGIGPVPRDPTVAWSYPNAAMCSLSSDPEGTREWCGTGWTGQPAVWERQGELWVAFGAYDRAVHVLDALTGAPRMAPFVTGDLIKGSLTVDPDGHPLLYVGSRDNRLRVLSFDQGELVELWALDAQSVTPQVWNDDWDGSPLVIDDHLIVGGENSNFHVVRLHRSYNAEGQVQVAPDVLAVVPGWDDELRRAVGDNVSIESSVTIVGDIAYAANSGGLINGWDLAPVRGGGQPERVFRFWIGDDTDATVVADDEGFLYAASEYERGNARSQEIGQVVKLDPRRPEDPLVWSVPARTGIDTGVWATPAIHRDLVVVPTADGRVLGLDRATGETRWTLRLPGPVWSSPVIVDNVLIQGDCGGFLHGFDLSQTEAEPVELWSTPVGGCIESTPVVWQGRIWVGTRGGFFHMITDPS